MDKKLSDEQIDRIAKNLLQGFSLSDEALDEIADAPQLRRSVRDHIDAENMRREKTRFVSFRTPVLAFGASTVLLCGAPAPMFSGSVNRSNRTAALETPSENPARQNEFAAKTKASENSAKPANRSSKKEIPAAAAIEETRTDFSAPSEITDDELVRLGLAGDETAFACLFERSKRLVVHLVIRFFDRREEIKDLSQQSFTKIYFAFQDFRGGRGKSFSSRLARLTVNSCYDELRRQRLRAENLFSDFSDEERECLEQITAENSKDTEKSLVAKDLA